MATANAFRELQLGAAENPALAVNHRVLKAPALDLGGERFSLRTKESAEEKMSL